jgi:hypothetical protein
METIVIREETRRSETQRFPRSQLIQGINISLPFLDLADMQQNLEGGWTRRRKTNNVVIFEVKSQWGAMQHCKNHAATTLNWRIYSLSAKWMQSGKPKDILNANVM